MTAPAEDVVTSMLQRLAEHGYAATEPRKHIIAAFIERQEATSAADLYARIRNEGSGIGLVTVYRTLDVLVACGLAHTVPADDTPQQERHFVPCGLGERHHHHLICTTCSQVQEITDCRLTSLEDDVAERSGYRIDRHALTLFGCCPNCQGAARIHA